MSANPEIRAMLYKQADHHLQKNGLEPTPDRYIRFFRHVITGIDNAQMIEVLEMEIAELTEKIINMGNPENEDGSVYKKWLENRRTRHATLCRSCKRQIGLFHCINDGCSWCAACAEKVKR